MSSRAPYSGIIGGAAARFAVRRLPLILLAAAIASTFIFAGDRDTFYRSRAHNWNSTKNMALAENLSPSHNFRLFLWRSPGADGGRDVYEMYSRFPIGGPALIKLAGAPFGDDLAAKLFAARILMLAMFAGATLFAYLALARATGNRWIAVAATLFALSSFWTLYYSDEISNESVMDMFALTMTFHGMVIFWQERRFGQLLAKSCAALLVGWHIFALLLPFIAIGLWTESAAAFAASTRGMVGMSRARIFAVGLPRAAWAAVSNRYVVLGIVPILVGTALLAFNFWNEYTAFGGEVPFRELPSVSSVITRTGQDDTGYGEYELERLAWGRFIGEQLYRVGVAAMPYALPFARDLGQTEYAPLERPLGAVALGLAATALALACVVFVRGRARAPFAVLALFGFAWAIPMRHNTAFLEFESVFFFGAPMVLVAAALMGARRMSFARFPRAGERACVAAAVAVAAVFAASALEMSRFERDPQAAEFRAALMADFSEMRKDARGASVFVPTFLRRYSEFDGHELTYTAGYALSGSALVFEDDQRLLEYAPDYAISRYRDEIPALATRDNNVLHLYDATMTNIADLRLLGCPDTEYGAAVACDNFAVHLEADRLTYIKDQCEPLDAESRFELSVFPQDGADLPREFRALGHQSMNFDFPQDDLFAGGGCMFQRKLPGYPIDRIHMSQWTAGDAPIWARVVRDAGALMAAACPDNEHGTAIACTDYAVYLKDATLTYINDRCAPKHREGRFLLNVLPQDPAHLYEQDGDAPHQSMNFDFPANGAAADGGCFFQVAIPDYPIANIEMGQWIKGAGGGGVWSAESDNVETLRFAPCESDALGKTVACGDFAIYLKNNALTYVKEPCAPSDARGRFLLTLTPANVLDLPEGARERGHVGANFDFLNQSADAGRCVHVAPLPHYPVESVETGQWTDDGFLWKRKIHNVHHMALAQCPPSAGEYGAIAACGKFAIYLRDNALTYVKDPCAPSDTRGRFYLSAFAADIADLPEARREIGHDSLNFNFLDQSQDAGVCAHIVRLPDYNIEYMETGQWDEGGIIWQARFYLPK